MHTHNWLWENSVIRLKSLISRRQKFCWFCDLLFRCLSFFQIPVQNIGLNDFLNFFRRFECSVRSSARSVTYVVEISSWTEKRSLQFKACCVAIAFTEPMVANEFDHSLSLSRSDVSFQTCSQWCLSVSLVGLNSIDNNISKTCKGSPILKRERNLFMK